MFAVVPDPIPARMKGLNRAEICDANFIDFVQQWRGDPAPMPAPDAPILPGSTLDARGFAE
ncbi:hypothetical protein DSI35_12255, partial [Mycobacterium tuberculosis]